MARTRRSSNWLSSLRRGEPVDVALIALVVALSATLVVLGGVTESGLAVALVTVALAAAATAARRSSELATRATTIASVGLCLAVAYIAAQLVPMPPSVLRAVSPQSAAIWSSADALLGHAPASHPVAIDPPATTFMLLTAACVAAFHWVVASYCVDPRLRPRLVLAIALIVVAFDAVAIGHKLTGATKLFGMYAPLEAGDRLLSPLLNPNHAAAVAAIGPPLLIGLALHSKDAWIRVFMVLGAVVSGATVLATLSRGGVLALAIELGAMGLYGVLASGRERRQRLALIAAIAGATAFIGLLAALEGLQNRSAGAASFSKSLLLPHAASVARSYFWVGAGRGGFGAASPAFEVAFAEQTSAHRYFDPRISHVESWPGQLVVDLGVPMAAVYVALLAIALGLAVRGAFRRPVTAGAAVALFGLGVHDLFDFSLEFVGVGLFGAALLGIVTASAGRSEARASTHGRIFSAALAFLLVLGVIPLVRMWKHQATDEARKLSQRWQSVGLQGDDQELRAAIQRHPSDPFFPLLAGVRVLSTVDAAPFLVRAVQLGPARAQTHFWLARWFAKVNLRGQAWAEYREALRLAPAYGDPVMNDMIALKAPLDDVDAVATDANAMERASHLLSRIGREQDAEALDERTITRFPPAIGARVRQIDRARKRNDIAAARALLTSLQAVAPNAPQAFLIEAELESDAQRAEAILVRGLSRTGEDVDLLFALVRRRSEHTELKLLVAEVDRLSRAVVAKDGSAWRVHGFLGDLELERKRPAQALIHYLDAATASPDGLARLEQAALLAESLGLHRAAEDAWRKLSYARPEDTHVQQSLARARAAATAFPGPTPLTAVP